MMKQITSKSLVNFFKEEILSNSQLSHYSIPNFEKKDDNSIQINLLTDFNKRGAL